MADQHANFVFAQVTVAPSPATSGTTIGISNVQAALFPDPASGAYNPTVWPANQMPLSTNGEVLRFTAKGAADSAGAGNTQFTIARLQEQNTAGTMTARSIQVGDWIALNITKKWFTDIETSITSHTGATGTGVHGLGTMSTQSASSVAITGGTITGITDLAVADGGTGASTAAGARSNLGAVNIAGDTMTGQLNVDGALISGGINAATKRVTLNLSSSSGAPEGAVDFTFTAGGIFRVGTEALIGTNDIIFQALPSSGYVHLESYNGSGLVLGTGGNSNPVIFRINRTEVARINATGFGFGTTPANPLHLVKSNLASGAAALFDIIQTAVNTTDTADAALNLKYNLSASSASNELVARIFKLDFTNTLTGGGVITNARVFNLATNTAAGTTTTNLEAILIETGITSGTVTTGIGLHIATLQGTTKWGIKDDSGGNWTLTGQLQASPGSASTPGYAFFGGTGEGMYRDSSPALLWSIGGAEKMRLNGTGLGIGVTPNSNLQTGGAIATPLASKSSAYTLTASDSIIKADATGGAFNVTLPTAASITGRQYTIKRINSGSNAVTVNTTSSQTIDGATTYSLSAQYKYVSVVSDGSNWLIVANN